MRAIARSLQLHRATVQKWVGKDVYFDQRGWKQGKLRKYTRQIRERVITLKRARIDAAKYFLGSPYVQMDYAKRYPQENLPSLWFIDESVRAAGLQTHVPKKRSSGASIVARQRFPIKTIVRLGRIQQACDFISKKYLLGRTEPISLFSTSYYQWFELYQIHRVSAEIVEEAVAHLLHCWRSHPIPHVVRIDNAMTFRGGGRSEAIVGRFLKFLLNRNVTPLFAAPYRSYTNPHIEGHNRTFAEKLWGRHTFTALTDIDRECTRFNAESEEFFRFKFAARLRAKHLRYTTSATKNDIEHLHTRKGKHIAFLRFVESWKERNEAIGIVVLDRFIDLPAAYMNQYVFASLDLQAAQLNVLSEVDQTVSIVRTLPFPYHA